MNSAIGIIGKGRFGSHLHHSLKKIYPDTSFGSREELLDTHWFQAQQVLCLAVRDDQLPDLVEQFAQKNVAGKTILIHSGATPLSLLNSLQTGGARVGKLHPLQAFTQIADAPIPPGTPFAFDGEIEDLVRPWVAAWDCKLIRLAEAQWAHYHMAAVVAANFLPLFVRAGADLMAPLMEKPEDALAWLQPLVQQAVSEALNPHNPLPYAGPAIRGDVEVIGRQAAMLEGIKPELAALYRECSAWIGRIGKENAGKQ